MEDLFEGYHDRPVVVAAAAVQSKNKDHYVWQFITVYREGIGSRLMVTIYISQPFFTQPPTRHAQPILHAASPSI